MTDSSAFPGTYLAVKINMKSLLNMETSVSDLQVEWCWWRSASWRVWYGRLHPPVLDNPERKTPVTITEPALSDSSVQNISYLINQVHFGAHKNAHACYSTNSRIHPCRKSHTSWCISLWKVHLKVRSCLFICVYCNNYRYINWGKLSMQSTVQSGNTTCNANLKGSWQKVLLR